jgi:sulfur carrier protein ThiS
MRILFIDNDGAGFADYIDIAENTTVEQFFKIKMSGKEASDYMIRVNRQPVARDYILQENDRITITPTKIEGAATS